MYSYDKIVFKNFLKFFNLFFFPFFFSGVKFALPNSDRNKLICYGCCYSDMQLYMILFLKRKKKKAKENTSVSLILMSGVRHGEIITITV